MGGGAEQVSRPSFLLIVVGELEVSWWRELRPTTRACACARAPVRAFSFLADDAYCKAVIREPLGSSEQRDDLRRHAIAALNAVPSQFQLHMHYILPHSAVCVAPSIKSFA